MRGKHIHTRVLLTIVSLFALLRIPSLIEPYWYGDEGIYQVLGIAIRDGRLLYRDIWDNKPPIVYLIYGLFNGDLFFVRSASLIFGVCAIVLFFLVATKLFASKLAIYLSTAVFALLFGTPFLEGNIANAENFMLFPTLFAAYLLLDAQAKNKKSTIKNYLVSGLLLSFSFLIKVVGIFDFLAFFAFLLVMRFFHTRRSILLFLQPLSSFNFKKVLHNFHNEFLFVLGFFVPILFSFLFFFIKGAFNDYYKAVFSQNIGYVGYGNYFLFPMGFLIIKFIVVAVCLVGIVRFRQYLGISGVFIYLWLVFSLFNALFAERPYTHYILTTLPAFSLFLGYILSHRNNMLLVNGGIFLIFTFVLMKNFYFYTKVFAYYKNYIDFIRGVKNVTSYQAFFDKNTPRDYAIADFTRATTTKNDHVFLWSDSAQIYTLSHKIPPGRYAVAYHVTFYKDGISETQNALERTKTKYIVVMKDSPEVFHFLSDYRLKFEMQNVKIYERKN